MKLVSRLQAIGLGLGLIAGLVTVNAVLIGRVLPGLGLVTGIAEILITGLIIGVTTYIFTGLAKRTGIFD